MKKITQNRSKEKIGNIQVLFAAMFLATVTHTFLWSQVTPDLTQIIAWEQFNNNYGNSWTIRWDEETGIPASIYGHKTTPYSGTPENIARSFLNDNRVIFKMRADLAGLVVQRVRESHGVNHVKFSQTYNGVPVYTGEYAVHIGSDNMVQMANGRYFPNIQIDTTPSIDETQAINYASSAVELIDTFSSPTMTELIVYPFEGLLLLAWKVVLPNEPYAIWRCFVNATNGEVIAYEDILMHTDGIGNVYPIDPVNSTLTETTIPRLLGPGYFLDGTYVKTLNSTLGEEAYSETNDFRYTPQPYTEFDTTHFDEANVYWLIDKFAYEYLPSFGFAGIGRQIEATVRVQGYDNANYSFLTGNLLFGTGYDYFWDLGKKDDIVYHEYTHAISDYIGLEYSGEATAMSEGYSDYFPASYTNDYRVGEWVTRCSDTGDLRIVDNDKSYFNYNNYGSVHYAWCDTINDWLNSDGGQHANSMIWSGSLWDLRELMGNDVTDFLVYKGLEYVNGYATFEGGREGILQADINFYQGQYQYTIKDVFGDRGIGDPDPPAAPTNFTLTNNNGNPRLQWSANTEPDMQGYKIYRNLGVTYQLLTTINDPNTTSYTDTYITIGNIRFDPLVCYKVKAFDTFNNLSNYSNSRCTPYRPSKVAFNDSRLLPENFDLKPNTPNPFNPTTSIRFDLPERSRVNMVIYDVLGRTIKTLVQDAMEPGFHEIRWNGKDDKGNPVSTGMYIYRLDAVSKESNKEFHETKKMVLLR